MISLNNREVTDISIDGVDFRDAPDFADAFVESAVWADTGKALTSEECDQLVAENYDHILELIWEER